MPFAFFPSVHCMALWRLAPTDSVRVHARTVIKSPPPPSVGSTRQSDHVTPNLQSTNLAVMHKIGAAEDPYCKHCKELNLWFEDDESHFILKCVGHHG